MGIKNLMKLIAEKVPSAIKDAEIKNYFGRKIAIDVSMALYQFLIAIRMDGGDQLTSSDGRVTSHIQGLFNRTIRMMSNGIKPLYVFDGKPPEFKDGTLANRKAVREEAKAKEEEAREEGDMEAANRFARRSVRVLAEHNEDAKRLLRLMGVPYVEAEGEAEAQCAALCKAGVVWGIGSEDMDSLTFGTPILLRNLTSSEAKKLPIKEIHLKEVLEGFNMTMNQFVDLCILCGCDYSKSIKGIGEKKAYDLIKKYGTLEKVVSKIREQDPEGKRYLIPNPYPIEEMRELFVNPPLNHEALGIDPKWTDPDEEGLVEFLVKEMQFDEGRVRGNVDRIRKAKKLRSQVRMDLFFKKSEPPAEEQKEQAKSTTQSSNNTTGQKGKITSMFQPKKPETDSSSSSGSAATNAQPTIITGPRLPSKSKSKAAKKPPTVVYRKVEPMPIRVYKGGLSSFTSSSSTTPSSSTSSSSSQKSSSTFSPHPIEPMPIRKTKPSSPPVSPLLPRLHPLDGDDNDEEDGIEGGKKRRRNRLVREDDEDDEEEDDTLAILEMGEMIPRKVYRKREPRKKTKQQQSKEGEGEEGEEQDESGDDDMIDVVFDDDDENDDAEEDVDENLKAPKRTKKEILKEEESKKEDANHMDVEEETKKDNTKDDTSTSNHSENEKQEQTSTIPQRKRLLKAVTDDDDEDDEGAMLEDNDK
ncbi:Flap endonuclease 1, FEN1 [Monocercomonoides exilis]|uniref:Flap endonuclease 1, FEN1 n=1 Tax=Monocercomonoides exilis TaxID=2049356 RepID=UPI003559DDE8|nr:Flap endonuclease 1, FEN1 [Monocercomonoides exilis]|eukprot:MONOS_14630.1-p1 / transcript=MONOS_14630.1 / gene=MONOS_14630 / organism=Monocercomonoides_exilis_PA203 / gene_product=Flap endonuclease 1, FEN1 / transcript_product=Flap endonuclease 1, FEN1 / location=Mono_scaffold01037:11841-14418(-) / protein_length=696 / sequence_SO=supercontig / SO=protein_coding / is_pseudo=false